MSITTPNGMLYLTWRWGTLDRDGVGLVFKRKAARLPSEERGYYRGVTLWPLYVRTFRWR